MTTFKSIIDDLGFRNHGEIFEEYYEDAKGEELTVHEFVEEELIPLVTEIFDEDPQQAPDWVKAILVMKEQYADDAGMVLEYFKLNSSHGEWAGRIIGACHNDGNLKLAREVFELLDETGFDS